MFLKDIKKEILETLKKQGDVSGFQSCGIIAEVTYCFSSWTGALIKAHLSTDPL